MCKIIAKRKIIYRNVAFISSLLSLRTQIDAKFPRIPKVATNGMKNPSTIFDTLRSSDILADVGSVSSSKISGKWIKVFHCLLLIGRNNSEKWMVSLLWEKKKLPSSWSLNRGRKISQHIFRWKCNQLSRVEFTFIHWNPF